MSDLFRELARTLRRLPSLYPGPPEDAPPQPGSMRRSTAGQTRRPLVPSKRVSYDERNPEATQYVTGEPPPPEQRATTQRGWVRDHFEPPRRGETTTRVFVPDKEQGDG